MRLVDADALLSELEKYNDPSAREKNEYLFGMQQRLETCIELVEDAPTVDAVPVKHGRWIYHPDWQADGECGYECSECGMGSDVDYPYCMLCGARMDVKEGDGNG